MFKSLGNNIKIMKSLEELNAIREKNKAQIRLRSENPSNIKVLVGMSTCGIASGARSVLTTLVDTVLSQKLENIVVMQAPCIGLCKYEPIVEILIPGHEKVTYVNITPEKAVRIIKEHLINGTIIQEYLLPIFP